MNNTIEIFPDNLPQLDYRNLYLKVAAQIKKDFHPFVVMENVPEAFGPEWLYSELKRMLNELIEKQNQNLGAVIYRVDLTEKMVRRSMTGLGHQDKLDELAALMLKREAQKVWIRHNYSG